MVLYLRKVIIRYRYDNIITVILYDLQYFIPVTFMIPEACYVLSQFDSLMSCYVVAVRKTENEALCGIEDHLAVTYGYQGVNLQ
jgi:hypothetical protein